MKRRALSDGTDAPMSTAAKVGIALGIGVAAAIGIGYAVSRKSTTTALGRPVKYGKKFSTETVKVGNRTLQVHTDPEMPIEKRVALIQDLVFKGTKNPQMRELALAITGRGGSVKVGKNIFQVEGANCPARDGRCEAAAVGKWVHENIRYTGDVGAIKHGSRGAVEPVDLFQGPHVTTEYGGGDCDDMSGLNATLLALNGIDPKLRVTASSKGGDWGHIYCLAGLPKNDPTAFVPVDTTLPGYYLGKEAQHARRVDFPA